MLEAIAKCQLLNVEGFGRLRCLAFNFSLFNFVRGFGGCAWGVGNTMYKLVSFAHPTIGALTGWAQPPISAQFVRVLWGYLCATFSSGFKVLLVSLSTVYTGPTIMTTVCIN